jgi:UDP-N-acetylmuramoylalanine--D-glutamate ligase
MGYSSAKEISAILKEPIGILGYGIEGQSTCRFLLENGFAGLVVFDQKDPGPLPSGVIYAGETDYLSKLNRVNFLFRSAGIRPDKKEILDFTERGGTLSSQVELLFKLVSRDKIIGVTGTLGKGTCCSLLHKMLIEGGEKVVLGGNVGTAVLDLVKSIEPGTWIILELSSFQLSTLSDSPGFAIVLRTTSEHMDWHVSQQEYWDHKANLVRFQQKGDRTVYCEDSQGSQWIAGHSDGQVLGYGADSTVKVTENEWRWKDLGLTMDGHSLLGSFNLGNVAAAAVTARNIGVSKEAVLSAASSFKGLEHRLEYVGARDGLKFFNDSYATRPEATIGALKAFAQEQVGLIMGGSEKHSEFARLSATIAGRSNIRAIALIGDTATRLERELESVSLSQKTELKICGTLEEALGFLLQRIQKGIILLSPACASFGLFADYKDRGNKFKQLVNAELNN